MKLTYNIKCVLRTDKVRSDNFVPIYLSVRVGPATTRLPTGKYILLKDWNSKDNSPKKTTQQGQLLASLLSKRMSDWETFMLQNEALGKPITLNVAVGYFKEDTKTTFYSFCEQTINSWEQTKAKGTIKNYNTTLKILKEFNPKANFGDINLSFITKLDVYLRTVRKNATNGCWPTHKNLKSLITEATKHELMPDKNPYRHFKLKTTPVTKAFLSIAEVKLLMQPETYDATPMQRLVRQIFLFGCFSGLRYSDLMNLQHQHIKLDPARIEIVMQKTKKLVTVPLNSFALQIIDERTKHCIKNPNQTIFPYVANQIINRNLKQLAEGYGIKKLITMHTSRISYASNLIESDVNLSTIMLLMGHSRISETAHYGKVLPSNLYASIDKLDNLYGHAI